MCFADERLGVVAGEKKVGHLVGFGAEIILIRAEAT